MKIVNIGEILNEHEQLVVKWCIVFSDRVTIFCLLWGIEELTNLFTGLIVTPYANSELVESDFLLPRVLYKKSISKSKFSQLEHIAGF